MTASDDTTGGERDRHDWRTSYHENRSDSPDERAVSDLIGFAGTFAVIMTAVILISTTGIGTLGELQSQEQRNNAERAFLILSDNLEAIENGNAPRRTSELDLHEGNLRAAAGTEIDVETSTGVSETLTPRSLVFEQGDTVIAYENGAVFRRDGNGGGLMERPPGWVCTEDRAVISLVTLDVPEDYQLGAGIVQVRGEQTDTRLLYPLNRTGANSSTDAARVSVTFRNSPYERSWRNHFEKSPQHWDVSSAGNTVTVTCDVTTDGDDGAVFVRETVINVSFVR